MGMINIVEENGVEYRRVELTEEGLWFLYRSMVCEMIVKSNVSHMFEEGVWEFSGYLDMSFEETRTLELSQWKEKIRLDLVEFLSDELK